MPVLLDKTVHELWLSESAKGRPPSLEDCARLQYGLQLSWPSQEGLYNVFNGLGKWPGKKLVCREMSRGLGKSITLAVMRLYAAEYVIPFIKGARSQNKRIITLARDVPHLVKEVFPTMVEMIVEYSPWLKKPDWEEVEGDGRDMKDVMLKSRTWVKTQLDLSNGVSIRGYTIRQSIRGAHVYLIDIDDLLVESNVNFSQEYMALIRGSILPALEPRGSILLLCGTPQMNGDLYDLIRDDPQWDYAQYPAFDEDGTLKYKEKNLAAIRDGLISQDYFKTEADYYCAWPYRLSTKDLEEARGKTRESEFKYLREYLLKRVADTNLLVHPEDLEAAKDASLHYARGVEDSKDQLYGGLDPSSLKQDDAGIIVGYVDPQGKRVLTYIETIRATGPNTRDGELKVLETFNEVSKRFNYPSWIIEGNGFQSILMSLMRNIDPLAATKIGTAFLTNNKSKETGWLAIRTMFRAGKMRLPYGPTPREKAEIEAGRMSPKDIEAVKITDKLITQLKSIQVLDGEIVEDRKVKNDLVSALWLYLRATEGVQSTASIAVKALDEFSKKDEKKPNLNSPEFKRQTNPVMDKLSRAQRFMAMRRRWL